MNRLTTSRIWGRKRKTTPSTYAQRAKRMILQDKLGTRAFDNCLENGDGMNRRVVALLGSYCREPLFRAAVLRNRRFLWPDLIANAEVCEADANQTDAAAGTLWGDQT